MPYAFSYYHAYWLSDMICLPMLTKLTHWFAGWMTQWVSDWPIDWLTYEPNDFHLNTTLLYKCCHCLTYALTSMICQCFTNWLTDWLAGSMAEWVTDWKTDSLIDKLIDEQKYNITPFICNFSHWLSYWLNCMICLQMLANCCLVWCW